MQETKLPSNSQYVIITVNSPVMVAQHEDETWLFNPNRRYIINAARIPAMHQFIETVSEIDSAALTNPLRADKSLTGAKVLVERFRERGVGDLLFLSGPLSYLHHMSGANMNIDLYAYSDRGQILTHAPFLNNRTVLCGPIEYDSIRMYNYHWFVGSATECDEEADQLNVYDALFKQLGLDYTCVDPRWKRPYAYTVESDFQKLDALYRRIFDVTKVDLRRFPYYVAAPFSNATLRCSSYIQWLTTLKQISQRRPVVVIGNSKHRLPDTDMSAGQFIGEMQRLGNNVISLLDATPEVRLVLALIARAKAVLCLDSAPLYMAQAVNTPAISLWGTHDPGVRIGYDEKYMRYAIWEQSSCNCSPCYAYSQFPVKKCPNGSQQRMCEVLGAVHSEQILSMLDKVESDSSKKV